MLFGTSKSKKVRRESIDVDQGTLTTGRHVGRRIDAMLGRNKAVLSSSAPGTAVVFDTRHWQVLVDPYHTTGPRDETGTRISRAVPVRQGWLIPR